MKPATTSKTVAAWRASQRLGPMAAVLTALLACACSDPPINGYIVPYADGGDWDADGGVGGQDGGAGVDGAAAADGDSGDASVDAADAAVPAVQLRFAMPDGNKDDFGGVCKELCKLQVNQNSIRHLFVQVLVNGQPAPNVPVRFQFKDPAAAVGLGEVLLEISVTDEQGVAMTEIKGGAQTGVFDVVASLPDVDPEKVPPVFFELHVISKAKGPMTVTLHYLGVNDPLSLGHLRFRLVQQLAAGQPACQDIELGGTLPSAIAELTPNGWDKPTAITSPFFLNWVQKEQQKSGQPVSFTVIGLARKSSTDAVRAAGCVDTGATVTYNPQTKAIEGDAVLVVVKDLPPQLKGVYEMTTHLDLLSVLPDPVEFAFKAIFDILSDPIAGILSLACKLGGQSFESFCGYIFENPKNPAIDDLKQPFGALIVKFLDSIIFGFLPDEVKKGLTAGSDLGKILTNLEVGGIIEIQKEPDAAGFLSKDHTKDEWMSLTYKWSLGQPCSPKDPACGKKTISFAQFQNNAIVGHFDLQRNALLSTLDIAKHGLLVKWGALVSFLVQKQLLPLLTGNPKIDSFEMLLKSLLAGQACIDKDTCCADFAKDLASQQSIVSEGFLTGICESLIKFGAGYIDAQLATLDTDTSKGEAMTIWTKDCPLFDDDQNMVIDTIGKSSQPCMWNMTFKIGGNPVGLDAVFYAVRQQ